ncbi:methionine--tRNA ligase [Hyphomicrobium sp.]|uniref:methionine--tRNA ligase n=1 Tax=Hyphomicrobium sp. TaxID=82 RepID=UPI002CC6F516|nr:methionine--tRNA ligase [Hyphomicrobium sp.]HRN89029.1 methionine--tRNA ligase [Hyphomicrobium sp.]HRQ26923.1 methionine--tRNA ligase [Hyphomicrobium sp.]
MSGQEKFYITTAISYPNGVPHIGHAYEAIATDAIARFERLDGKDVFFLTGTDEHGLKMKQTAAKEGIAPQLLADRNAARFIEMVEMLGVSNDDFIRTTEPRHYEACAEIWRRMEAAGDIFTKKYGGWYSVRDETYFKEAETEVRDDGVRYATPTGTPVEWTEEETFFFRLSAYEERLLKFYEDNPDFILPVERKNEVVSFVKSGLEDLSISRSTLDWGIPVPNAPGHVMYVWVDALTNYITATGLLNTPQGGRAGYWPADVHVIGKDIVRFHAVYWPAFLMSAGIDLPKRIFSHGMVLSKGEKISKSVGNVVDPSDLVRAYGRDQLRYFLLREVMFGQDGNYSPEAIANRINADLANNLGNLAQRSLSMIFKNCDGKIPEPGPFTPEDQALLAAADALYGVAREAMNRQAITPYLNAVWAVIADANGYFAAEEPWAKKKSDPARMGTILYVTAEVVRQFGILAQPAMPELAAKLLDLLALGDEDRVFAKLGSAGRLAPGTVIPEPKGVFPRYVDPEEAAKAEVQPKQKPQKGGKAPKSET